MSAPGDRIAVGSRLVRRNGALVVVIVVKATFALTPSGPMSLVDPKPIQTSDRFQKDDPRRSVVAASDLAPELPGGEITFVGSAYASPPTKLRGVRLAVARGPQTLVDKALHVYGDRAANAGETPPEPAPFATLPIVYERAYGGPGFHDNPCGVGASASGTVAYPNIVYPEAVRGNVPAGFGPIAAANASRKRHLAAGAEAGLGALVLEYDERTPTIFFHAAPADQRVPGWFGDEQITLGGLLREHPLLETRLPGAAARATIRTKVAAPASLLLRLDTVQIDGDAGTASLLFRGQWSLPSDDALVGLSIVGELALPDGSVQERVAPALPEKAPPPRRTAAALAGTVALDAARGLDEKVTAPLGIDIAPPGPAVPFPDAGRAPSNKPAPPIPGAPWGPTAPSAPPVQVAAPDEAFTRRATMALSLEPSPDAPSSASSKQTIGAVSTQPSSDPPPSLAAKQTIGAAASSEVAAVSPGAPPPPPPEGPVFKNVPVGDPSLPSPAAPVRATPARPKPPDIRSKLYPSG